MALEDPRSISDIRGQLWILGTIRVIEGVTWSSISTYSYFMIQSFHEVPEHDIAFYSSMLISVFTLCESVSGMLWARVSDRIGRKPTVLIGLFCGIITALALGLSESIAVVVVARAFGGLCNPIVLVVQTCQGELATEEQHINVFNLVTFIQSFGNLLGPAIGGLLSDPAMLYPTMFSASIWIRYPYLLPNLAVILLQVIAILVVFFLLKETHYEFKDRHDFGTHAKETIKRFCQAHFSWGANLGTYKALDESDETLEENLQQRITETTIGEGTTRESFQSLEIESLAAPKVFTRQVILQILSASLLAFHKVSSDFLMSTLLSQSTDTDTSQPRPPFFLARTGFGYGTQKIAIILLSGAIVRVIIQIRFVRFFVHRLDGLRAYRWILAVYPFTYILTAFVPSLLPSSPVLQLVAFLPDLWIKVTLAAIGYMCSNILLIRAASSPESLARVNGAAMSFSCLARAVGPLLCGKLFSIGLKIQHLEIPFWVLSCVALFGAVESFWLLDGPKSNTQLGGGDTELARTATILR